MYVLKDLYIGATIEVVGRQVQIVDCDPATRKNLEIFEETSEFEEGDEPGEERSGPVSTIADLFGGREVRENSSDAAPLPDYVPGPIDHFYRLDLDGNRRISLEDLTELMRPIQSGIRLNTVIATLDTDGDGALSPEEFWGSMAD